MRTLRAIGVVLACVCAGLVIGEAQSIQVPQPAPVAPVTSWGQVGGALVSTGAQITPASATGITVNNPGENRTQTYKVTVDRTAFVCAAVTCNVVIASLPPKTFVQYVFGQLTTVFACASTCTSTTLSMGLGSGAADVRYLAAAFDVDAATVLWGDADAEMGTLLTRAAAVQGGYQASMGTPSDVSLRLTSGTGNVGDGAATFLSTGSITFWITATVLP